MPTPEETEVQIEQSQNESQTEPSQQTESKTETPAEEVVTCASPGCDKPAKLQCPTCVKYGGSTRFCGQECFKANWAVHSRSHPEMRARAEFTPPLIEYTGPLRPAYVTPRMKITDPKIKKPDYAETGEPISEQTARAGRIAPVYTKDEIDGIRAAAKLTREALDFSCTMIKPGVTTDEIDRETHKFIVSRGGYPSPLNYRGFPKSICTSINEVICHGIPDCRPLEEGDIINIDVSVYLNGFHGDCNETHPVGKVDFESLRLLKGSFDSLEAALKLVKPNTLFRDFGEAVSHSIAKHKYSSVRSYCGHGIGHLFHCAPNIPHYARNKATGACKPGMIFCIEPMINAGDWKDTHWADDWTATTVDGKRSVQYEHTILCTETGYELLSARTEKSKKHWWEMPEYKDELAKYNEFINKK